MTHLYRADLGASWSYKEELDRITRLVEDELPGYLYSSHRYELRCPPDKLLQWLPDGVELEPMEPLCSAHDEKRDDSVGFMTESRLRELSKQCFGRTIARSRRDTKNRLLRWDPRNEALPEYNENDELRIKITDEGDYGSARDPYVPGYVLTSRSGKLYGFMRNPEGDPYASADIPLADSQINSLAEEYRKLGLTQLANNLIASKKLTVSKLVDYIRHATYYPLLDDNNIVRSYPYRTDGNSFEGFSQLIRDGKLHAQCNGSAQFLKLSLENIFGKGTADIADGYVLSDEISKVRHVQTIFAHNGRVYILDATGSSSTAQFGIQSRQRRGFSWRRNATRPMTAIALRESQENSIQDPVTDTVEHGARYEISDTFQEREVPAIADILEERLCVAFGVRTRDQLYARLVDLKQHDPIRRAVEAVRTDTRGELELEDLEAIVKYLHNYRQASDDVLQRLNLPKYNPDIIRNLEDALGKIAQVHEEGSL